MTIRHFTNELGNRISVEVTAQPIDGCPGVLIHIIGPTSETENHVTLVEAAEIFRQLGAVICPPN